MPKVGDKVLVKIGGADTGSTTLAGTLTITAGASMTVPGTIIADQGDSWLVELSIQVDGKNRIAIAKRSLN